MCIHRILKRESDVVTPVIGRTVRQSATQAFSVDAAAVLASRRRTNAFFTVPVPARKLVASEWGQSLVVVIVVAVVVVADVVVLVVVVVVVLKGVLNQSL